MTDTLVRRYTYGNFNNLPIFGPEADFLLGIPVRQRELVSLARAQVLEQKRVTKAVLESNVSAAASICRELSIQTEHLEQAIAGGAAAVALAIEDLGDRISGELGEIRWELVQLRALSEQILAVLRRPRSTEARELLDQGVRNLVNDKVEQAEERFNLALRLDNTDYQILMNLSAVELRKGNAPRAVAFVHDALTLPQNLDTQARADALWHLARIHYAIHDYPKAFELAQQSTTVLSAPRRVLQLGVYAILGGRLTEGLSLIGAAVLRVVDRAHEGREDLGKSWLDRPIDGGGQIAGLSSIPHAEQEQYVSHPKSLFLERSRKVLIHALRQDLDQFLSHRTGIRVYREEANAVAKGGGLVRGEASAGEVRNDGAERHAPLGGQSACRGQHVVVKGECGSHRSKSHASVMTTSPRFYAQTTRAPKVRLRSLRLPPQDADDPPLDLGDRPRPLSLSI